MIVVVRSGVPDSTLVPQIEVSVTLTVALPVYRGSCSVDCSSRPVSHSLYAAFQSPRANGAHDFEVGKIPVQPYVAFHSRTEPRWLIVLSCSFLLCLLLALINSVNRVFVLQRTHALHTCSCTSLTQNELI